MFKINKNKLVLISCLLGVITANASTFIIGNKGCSADATYEAVSRPSNRDNGIRLVLATENI